MSAQDAKYEVNNCAVIILAAGQSSRLGQPKQLLKYQSKTLLQHAINTAKQSSAKSTIVVLGSGVEQILNTIDTNGLHIIKNDDWQSGIASSISYGVKSLQNIDPMPDAVILMTCDQPFVSSDLLNELIAKQKETGKLIIASQYDGTIGIPALFHKSLFEQLTALKGDSGAKKLMEQNRDDVTTVPFPKGGIDIDTLDDYEALKK
jgi:molybdenum cofactor cytidylyltransferase